MKATSCLKSLITKSVLFGVMLFGSVKAFTQPVANFSANTYSGCAPILVRFTDQSTGNPSYWHWDLGNGTISYLQNPSVTYFTPGTYTVKLIVKNTLGQDSLSRNAYIQVYAAPVVGFSASVTSGCSVVNTTFTNTSNAQTWQWDFGDGIFSNEQHPSHIYQQPGSYNVSLKAVNDYGCSLTLLKSAYINVHNVDADFSQTVPNRCLPTKISFRDNTNGTGTLSYKWFFGNGDSSSLQNPVYTYPLAGDYQVKLVVFNEFGCRDTVIKSITVQKPVSAFFTASNTHSCTLPASIQFNNDQIANNNYAWSFGDTTVSSLANPVHVFRDTGSYTVKLVVRNTNGCSDSLERVDYINIQKPLVSFTNLPDSGCTGFNKVINFGNAGSDSVVACRWDFGDGGTSSAITPSYVFNGERYFTVSLIATGVSGCTDTLVMPNAIRTGYRPAADFNANARIACAQTRIGFTDQSRGNVTQWQWNFGDNGVDVVQNPMYRFSDTGHLGVELIVFNGGCTDTLTRPGYVYIKPSVAKMKIDFSCQNPYQFSFTNLSIGADSWLWDFGDGSNSTERNPVHLYSDTGLYQVSLTTYNQATGCDGYRAKSVLTTRVTPQFYASDSILCKGDEVTFTSLTHTGEASRFFWYFGDGTTENTVENNVKHRYEEPGNYTVKLIVNNRVNCRDSVVKTAYISVKEVKANFGIPVPVVCSDNQVVFSDSSVAGSGSSIQNWYWNYGDGNTDTLSSPPFSHTYGARGNYIVSLTVADNNGCRASYTSGVPVLVKKIFPQFWPQDTVKCTNTDLKFICPFSEPGVSYRWDFGDGNTAVNQLPRHQYQQEGSYTVKLTVSHAAGCTDSFTLGYPVIIENPRSAFAISDSFRNCPPLIVQFTNESVNADDEVWDFGDGTSVNAHNPSHFYSYPGVYTATLTVKGRGGCTNTSQRTIVVQGPKGSLQYGPLNFCQLPATVTFRAITTDASSFVWDFNDGTTASNSDSVVTHQYNNVGAYMPKLMLVDNEGCRVPVQGLDTIQFATIKAGFTIADTNACSDGHIQFTNTTVSPDQITNYQWHFGDGNTTQNEPNPSHFYQAEGTYYPSLTVTTASGCRDSFVTPVPVRVALLPDVSVTSSSASGCMPMAVSFNAVAANGSLGVTAWHWDFGNGVTSNIQNPPAQTFTAAGNYPVAMSATAANGCIKKVTKNIVVHPQPDITINGRKDICKNQSATLVATGAVSWQWLQPVGTLNCTTCDSVVVSPLQTTDYIVKGINGLGCTGYDTVTVRVAQPFAIAYNPNAKLCKGSSVTLQVSGADLYVWSPAAGLSNINTSSPVANPDQSTVYTVRAKDRNGCYSDSARITVTVNSLPQLDAGADKTITTGSSVELVPVVSADVTDVRWSPTGGIFRNGDYGITVKPTATTEYTATAKNTNGCVSTDKVMVTVINDDPAGGLFIPNTFSPNGDGMNDIFYPRSSSSVKISRMWIMNREGVIVFEKTNFYANNAAAGWDGTLRGVKLPPDVYVYGVQLTAADGKEKIVPGNVALVR